MNDLVTVTEKRIGNELVQAVDARELHSTLKVGNDFSTWIKGRLQEAQALENADYEVFLKFQENPLGGRPIKEYALSLDMAKHISMLERSDIGRKVRQYFIDIEKKIRSSNVVSARFEDFAKIAKLCGLEDNQAILAANKAIRKLYSQDTLGLLEITLQSPDQELQLTATDLGAKIEPKLSAVAFNRLLESRGFQESFRNSKGKLCYRLTTKGKKYGVYLDTGKKHSDGTPVQQIKWKENIISNLL
jgi:phage anti-repressor protein